MDWEQVSAMVTSIVSVGGILWRIIVNANKKLTDRIVRDTAFLAQQLHEIKEQQKFLSEKQDSINKSLNELKGRETNNQIALKEFERSVKFSLDQNLELLQDLKKSKAEWITDNLLKVKGRK